jgi:hypothetical protein
MAAQQGKSQHSTGAAEILRTWASFFHPAPVSWGPVTEMIRVAEAEAQKLDFELNQLLSDSDAQLSAISLRDPLMVDAGLNRWLKKEREEAYSDRLKWILDQLGSRDQLGSAADVLDVLGITESEIVAVANSQGNAFKIDREKYIISVGRLDLLLTLDNSVMIVIEVKKYSAESSDTAKQAGYYGWSRNLFDSEELSYLTTDAAEEKSENFSILRWEGRTSRTSASLSGYETVS